jgi:hypothetical protein
MLENPALTDALLKLEYPLADYRAFAVAWPHTATEVEDLHRMLMSRPLSRPLTADDFQPDARRGKMHDIRLLEAAARAAGLPWDQWVIDGDDSWNPLTDDGDALRLAVKLRLNVNFEEWDGAEYACAVPHNSHHGQDEVIDDDADAAARRAIVRAAAALLKGTNATDH